ncbi:hypothetical protein J4E81_006597 [Alternaria sp. BMP 2799]|nr:hypothetical protein J4E81_006597 [Alternaria sp. BMP 2799]
MSRVTGAEDPARQELEEVVKTSTHKRLQTVLLEICNESPEAFKLAHDKLFVKEEEAERPAVSLLDGPLAENSAFKLPRAQKRGRRYDLEIYNDEDFWTDHDEDCHGEIDTEEMREEYPEGFVWSCCKGYGDAKGCRTDPHEPRSAKRSRTESPSGESSSERDSGSE